MALLLSTFQFECPGCVAYRWRLLCIYSCCAHSMEDLVTEFSCITKGPVSRVLCDIHHDQSGEAVLPGWVTFTLSWIQGSKPVC